MKIVYILASALLAVAGIVGTLAFGAVVFYTLNRTR